MRRVVTAAADLAIPVVVLALPHQLVSVRTLVTAFLPCPLPSTIAASPTSPVPHPLRAPTTCSRSRATNVVCKVSSVNLQATAEPRALWRNLVDLARTTTDALGRVERTDVLAATAQRIWPSAK